MILNEVKCMYCGRQNRPNEGMFIIRKAIKKPYSVNRWMNIGHCCDDCEAAGNPLDLDLWRAYQQTNSHSDDKGE